MRACRIDAFPLVTFPHTGPRDGLRTRERRNEAAGDTGRPHLAVDHSAWQPTPLYDLVRLPARALDAEAAQRAFYLGYTRSYPVEVLARKR